MESSIKDKYIILGFVGFAIVLISSIATLVIADSFNQDNFVRSIVFVCCNLLGWLLYLSFQTLIFEDFKDKMLQGPLQRWLTAAGITKKITFHCTRHSFGSLHVEMGTDMAVIQAYLGHKNITTTQIYSKIAAQQMCQVVDKITLKRKEA